MDKRGYIEVESPPNIVATNGGAIRKKIRYDEKLDFENNGNAMNYVNLNVNVVNDSLYPGFDVNDLCFDDDDDLDLSNKHDENKLDLSSFKRCRVNYIEVYRKTYEKILHVQEKGSSSTAKCCLRGVWFDTDVSQKDVVSLMGVFNNDRNLYMITNESGIIVIHPDYLVAGTTVVGSLFCTRKAVVAERFKSVGLTDTKAMNIGSIVHEILQKCLKDELASISEIKNAARSIFQEAGTMQLLYSSNMTLKKLETEVDPYIHKIYQFMQYYIMGNENEKCIIPLQSGNQIFEGRIADIQDIEENIWSPRLGLKGKIDATVSIYPPNNFTYRRTVPVEIKTGRPSFSFEHKGQLVIYQLMLKDMGKQIDSGLLLYIKDGIMSEFRAPRNDEHGLITLRNRFAKYMQLDIVERDKTINLPEPIVHQTACERCPYNVLCCAFQKKDKNHLLSPKHPLYEVMKSSIEHLNDDHLTYFCHWCHLITLEHNEMQRNVKIKHLWTKTPEFRAARGIALINLSICDLVVPQSGDFLHPFTSNDIDFTTMSFEIGDYLIVSTDKRVFITAGRVAKIEPSIITLTLPKDLTRQYLDEKFHLDKYESQNQAVFNFSNIGALLDNDEKINKLREIIIDKKPATFAKSLPSSHQGTIDKILVEMNSVQRKAIMKALTCENYMLIKGLPGTGKSQTLVNLIHILTEMKKSILITSHTNSAVDNILMRLKERGIRFLRLGNARIHPSLRGFSETTVTADCKTVEELEKVYESFQVVACTCLGSSHPLLTRKQFDYCLVDEATQIYQPTVIRPLMSANKFILVGDPEQLAPLVRSNDARVLGANESLFERLDSEISTFVLGLQYRMNRMIVKLANNLTYNGELACANDVVGKAKIDIPNMNLLREKFSQTIWLAKVASPHLDQACTLVNTGNVYEMASKFLESINSADRTEKSKLYINYCEIAIVLHIVDILIECGVDGKSIGIIAPYRDQVETLKKIFASYHTVEVNTVDQYQGRDKKIIIYSCTLSSNSDANATKQASEIEILEDRRRLTVAITRAKHKLIMIGDVNCLNKYTPFRDLFKHMNSMSKVQVEDGKFGFSWQALMDSLKSKLENL